MSRARAKRATCSASNGIDDVQPCVCHAWFAGGVGYSGAADPAGIATRYRDAGTAAGRSLVGERSGAALRRITSTGAGSDDRARQAGPSPRSAAARHGGGEDFGTADDAGPLYPRGAGNGNRASACTDSTRCFAPASTPSSRRNARLHWTTTSPPFRSTTNASMRHSPPAPTLSLRGSRHRYQVPHGSRLPSDIAGSEDGLGLIEQHQTILAAIDAGDADAADRAMRYHLTEILRSLPKVLADRADLFE